MRLYVIDPCNPLVSVGKLYQQGCFREVIDTNGNKQVLFPTTIPAYWRT